MAKLIGALDQGTQSTRFFLFDANVQPVASAQADLPQIYPKAGWCEHDPMAILQSAQRVIQEACEAARSKLSSFTVAAVGITNQRETTVVWDRHSGQPLHNAIVWHDNRTRGICHRFEKEYGGRDCFRAVTGLPISTYFSGFKMRWLIENVPAVESAVKDGRAMFGTVDSWLLYNLTGGCNGGVYVTDVTNASRTLMMDIRTRAWHEPFVRAFGLMPDMLPRITSCSEVLGTIKGGVLDGVPLAGCLGDQQAATLGQKCQEGAAKCTYGTGCFLLLNTGTMVVDSSHGLLSTVAFQLGPDEAPNYALEGSVAVAGLGVSWLRDQMRLIDSADEIESLARSVDDCGGVYFVPAFAGLLAPRWRDDARGTIVGLSSCTNRAHIARAMLEAICFQVKEVLDAMRADAACDDVSVLRCDGGAAKNDLLMQLQADLLQVPVVRPSFRETTSLGAAFAAGLAVRMWTREQVFKGEHHDEFKFEPLVSEDDMTRRYACWRKAVERSLDLDDLVP